MTNRSRSRVVTKPSLSQQPPPPPPPQSRTTFAHDRSRWSAHADYPANSHANVHFRQSTNCRRRLIRDFKRLSTDPPSGISGSPCPDNIMLWNAVIFGPGNTFVATLRLDRVADISPVVGQLRHLSKMAPSVWFSPLTNRIRTSPPRSNSSPGCSIPTSMQTESSAWTFSRTGGHPPMTSPQS